MSLSESPVLQAGCSATGGGMIFRNRHRHPASDGKGDKVEEVEGAPFLLLPTEF